ncbi:MAG: hypothetical protein EZS28_017820, partial [Streblomastix strix]
QIPPFQLQVLMNPFAALIIIEVLIKKDPLTYSIV